MDLRLTPYLLVNGKAKEAVDFYADVFAAEVESCELLKDWPQDFDGQIPEGYENNVMHAHLNIGESQLMLADVLPGQKVEPGSTITIMIDVKQVSDAEKLYSALISKGEEIMPLQESSFSPAMGQVKDKYGVEWQLVTEYPDM